MISENLVAFRCDECFMYSSGGSVEHVYSVVGATWIKSDVAELCFAVHGSV